MTLMAKYRKRINAVALFCGLFFCACSGYLQAQEEKIPEESKLFSTQNIDLLFQDIYKLYAQKKFEQAYDAYQKVYRASYANASEADQIRMLDFGIRLSFIVEKFADLDQYIQQYYELDPNFSAASLKESSDLLSSYISGFISSKDELFVYVNKRKQSLDLITASITVFTRRDIERLGARNLLDLVRLAPGFVELGDNNERLIGTRGSSSTTLQDVLILIDGHRISDVLTSTNAPDWLNLDYVEQVELMRGPGSALYGGNAFNAVINVVTKNSHVNNINGLKLRAGNGNNFSELSYGSNIYRLSYEYGRRLSNVESFYFCGTYFQSGGSAIQHSRLTQNDVLPDIYASDTIMQANNNGIEYINAYKPGYSFLLNYHNQAFKMTVNAESNSFKMPRPVSQNLWKALYTDIPNARTDKREFIQTNFNLFDKNTNFKHNLLLKLGGDHFHKDIYTPQYSGTNFLSQRLLGHEYRATGNLEFSSDSLTKHKLFKGDQYVLAGIESYINYWDYQYFEANDTSMYSLSIGDYFTELDSNASQTEHIAAAYFQIEQHLIPNRLIGTFGVRINYHNAYSRFGEFQWGRQFSPRFALIYRAKPNAQNLHWLKLKLLYNSAFLPPPFLYRKRGIRGFVGEENLKPQEIESGEFIVSGDVTKGLSYGVFFYSNKLDQIIVRSNNVYINSKETRINAGIEAEVKYIVDFGRNQLNSFINYSHAFEANFGDTLNHRYFEVLSPSIYSAKSLLRNYPVNTVSVGLDFTTNALKENHKPEEYIKPALSFGVNAQYIGQSQVESMYWFNTNNNIVLLDAVTPRALSPALIFDARFSVHFQNLKIGISANNMLNHHYYLPAIAYGTKMLSAEGRILYININYRFN